MLGLAIGDCVTERPDGDPPWSVGEPRATASYERLFRTRMAVQRLQERTRGGDRQMGNPLNFGRVSALSVADVTLCRRGDV
jgi:hypothetical protein